MPKIKLSESAEADKSIVAAIKYGMSKYDVSPDSIALAMRRDKMTFFRRKKHPGNFTIDELRGISRKIHIPLEKLVKGEIQ
jgi:hypothetical protein